MLWLGKPDLHVTWEPASSLPAAVIEEFEKGSVPKAVHCSVDHYGHGTNTLVVEHATESQPRKKARTDRPLVECSRGLVYSTQNTVSDLIDAP